MKTLKNLGLIATIACLTNCGTSGAGEERAKTPEELKAELIQLEQTNPLDYLDDQNVKLQPQEKKVKNGGLFREAEFAPDGGIIEGDFINKATLAKFKDIVVKVSFYSQTKTLIEEKSYVLYEYYEPHSTKQFSMKIDVLPQAYVSFGFEITGATAVYE